VGSSGCVSCCCLVSISRLNLKFEEAITVPESFTRAVGARAVGTRRGDGPSRGLASKADGAGWLREMARAPKVDGATNGG